MRRSPRPITRPPSLTELVAGEIRARILRGDFGLGEALSENGLAAELGVSKTPVREALLRLEREGLVTVVPQRGTFVFDMSDGEIRELGELRELLETGALRLALGRDRAGLAGELSRIVAAMREALARGDAALYRRLDTDWHFALFLHAGNRFLLRAYESVAFRIHALLMRLSVEPQLNEVSLHDHEAMAEGIRAGRDGEVEARLIAHIRATTRNYLARRAAARRTQPEAAADPRRTRRRGRGPAAPRSAGGG